MAVIYTSLDCTCTLWQSLVPSPIVHPVLVQGGGRYIDDQLLPVTGAVCVGINLVAYVVVVVGAVDAVGAVGAETIVVTLLVMIFA